MEKSNGYSQMVLPFLSKEDVEAPDYVLEIIPGEKTCAELLCDLSMTETEDYCKYLQIPVQDAWSKKQMTDAIAQEFCQWFARFNNLVQTSYSLDGTRYVASRQLDVMFVLRKMLHYSGDLDYVLFSKNELRKMADNIGEGSEWVDALFAILCYVIGFSESMASQTIEEMYSEIMNGCPLSEIMSIVDEVLPKRAKLMETCEFWEATAGMMLSLELPMLKGRSRNRYTEDRDLSPWEIDMSDDELTFDNSKDRRMFEFPLEIQEAMFNACPKHM